MSIHKAEKRMHTQPDAMGRGVEVVRGQLYDAEENMSEIGQLGYPRSLSDVTNMTSESNAGT